VEAEELILEQDEESGLQDPLSQSSGELYSPEQPEEKRLKEAVSFEKKEKAVQLANENPQWSIKVKATRCLLGTKTHPLLYFLPLDPPEKRMFLPSFQTATFAVGQNC
jgi:hypothetical protein